MGLYRLYCGNYGVMIGKRLCYLI